ncbi:hypothetical protein EJ08DRAFT_279464 [Tothia fuscella]|uniref:Uncharacterized protein n=1 Tax=Tothia fuscella TaxID=1048955 RepID=A0A9P4NPT9_9PEZI|nr:hypothetical protein EJ08DRAFT_279464 [Tothia fuscella]
MPKAPAKKGKATATADKPTVTKTRQTRVERSTSVAQQTVVSTRQTRARSGSAAPMPLFGMEEDPEKAMRKNRKTRAKSSRTNTEPQPMPVPEQSPQIEPRVEVQYQYEPHELSTVEEESSDAGIVSTAPLNSRKSSITTEEMKEICADLVDEGVSDDEKDAAKSSSEGETEEEVVQQEPSPAPASVGILANFFSPIKRIFGGSTQAASPAQPPVTPASTKRNRKHARTTRKAQTEPRLPVKVDDRPQTEPRPHSTVNMSTEAIPIYDDDRVFATPSRRANTSHETPSAQKPNTGRAMIVKTRRAIAAQQAVYEEEDELREQGLLPPATENELAARVRHNGNWARLQKVAQHNFTPVAGQKRSLSSMTTSISSPNMTLNVPDEQSAAKRRQTFFQSDSLTPAGSIPTGVSGPIPGQARYHRATELPAGTNIDYLLPASVREERDREQADTAAVADYPLLAAITSETASNDEASVAADPNPSEPATQRVSSPGRTFSVPDFSDLSDTSSEFTSTELLDNSKSLEPQPTEEEERWEDKPMSKWTQATAEAFRDADLAIPEGIDVSEYAEKFNPGLPKNQKPIHVRLKSMGINKFNFLYVHNSNNEWKPVDFATYVDPNFIPHETKGMSDSERKAWKAHRAHQADLHYEYAFALLAQDDKVIIPAKELQKQKTFLKRKREALDSQEHDIKEVEERLQRDQARVKEAERDLEARREHIKQQEAELVRKAEAAREAEVAQLAEFARQAEVARQAEIARQADIVRQAEAEASRHAEIEASRQAEVIQQDPIAARKAARAIKNKEQVALNMQGKKTTSPALLAIEQLEQYGEEQKNRAPQFNPPLKGVASEFRPQSGSSGPLSSTIKPLYNNPWTQAPPPAPSPAHAQLPPAPLASAPVTFTPPTATISEKVEAPSQSAIDHFALENLAREKQKANRYAPKTPSGLRDVSRLSTPAGTPDRNMDTPSSAVGHRIGTDLFSGPIPPAMAASDDESNDTHLWFNAQIVTPPPVCTGAFPDTHVGYASRRVEEALADVINNIKPVAVALPQMSMAYSV